MLTVIEPAALPTAPDGPNRVWVVALAALAGLLLAVAGVVLFEFVDDSVKTKDDLEELAGVPTLGLVSRLPSLRAGQGRVLVLSERDSPGAEAYRLFAVYLSFACRGESSRVLLVTSAADGEGKSTTAANVAAALAESGKDVLLVDLDLRNPTLHTLFGLPDRIGVTSLLLNSRLQLADCILDTPLAHLKLLPSGPLPPNPTALVSRFGEQLLESFREMADFVIVDGPPLLAGADALALAGAIDGAVLVAHAGRTPRRLIRAAREALGRARVRLLGAFLNAVLGEDLGLYGHRSGKKRWSVLRRGWLGRRPTAPSEAIVPYTGPSNAP
jgi:capsular exopolysaccharide synthesis family protein